MMSQLQNRVFLLLLSTGVMYVVHSHISLHQGAHQRYQNNVRVEWLQPSALMPNYPNPIGNTQWGVDYISIESILQRAKFLSDGSLLVNDNTLGILQQAAAKLELTLGDDDLQRVIFLSQKSSPERGASQLGQLLGSYYRYDPLQQTLLQELRSATGDNKYALLETIAAKTSELQQRYFGIEVAEKLFSVRNRRVNYLYARQLVNLDASLNSEQKIIKLKQLENQVKAKPGI